MKINQIWLIYTIHGRTNLNEGFFIDLSLLNIQKYLYHIIHHLPFYFISFYLYLRNYQIWDARFEWKFLYVVFSGSSSFSGRRRSLSFFLVWPDRNRIFSWSSSLSFLINFDSFSFQLHILAFLSLLNQLTHLSLHSSNKNLLTFFTKKLTILFFLYLHFHFPILDPETDQI